jgi:hypothetical protein
MSKPIADWVEFCELMPAELSPRDRRLVHDAVVSSVIEGWTPDKQSVALLGDFAAGKITIEQYRARVLKRAGVTQP